jgi:hypothetical protein
MHGSYISIPGYNVSVQCQRALAPSICQICEELLGWRFVLFHVLSIPIENNYVHWTKDVYSVYEANSAGVEVPLCPWAIPFG